MPLLVRSPGLSRGPACSTNAPPCPSCSSAAHTYGPDTRARGGSPPSAAVGAADCVRSARQRVPAMSATRRGCGLAARQRACRPLGGSAGFAGPGLRRPLRHGAADERRSMRRYRRSPPIEPALAALIADLMPRCTQCRPCADRSARSRPCLTSGKCPQTIRRAV